MAAAVASAAAEGESEEEDLFVARAALTMAALRPPAPDAGAQRQVAAAQELVRAAYAAASGHPAPDTPLLHFVALFLEALAARSEQLAQLLQQHYQPSLDRDPQLWQLVMRCSAVHLPQPAGGAGGMGGLLSMFGSMLSQPT
jgi:hypothetical protein